MKTWLTLCFITLMASATFAQTVDMSIFHGMAPRNIGPAGMSGRVTSFDVDLSNKKIIYAGAAAGGIWKSKNGGDTWTPIFENEETASIGDIKIYQKNPNIIYVGTGEGNPRNSLNSGWGMYKSMDAGRTWTHIGLEKTRQIHRVIVHPNNPDIVWAGVSGSPWAAHPERGVYKTIDGGQHWKKVLYVNDKTGVADMRIDPSNPNKILVAMWEHLREPWFFKSGGAGSGLYVTMDGGESWQKQSTKNGLPKGELGRMGLAISPTNPATMYAYIESKENAVYGSTDGGNSWSRRSKKGEDIGGRPFYYADIYVDTKNENRVYSIATEVTVSEDGGKTWGTFAPGNRVHTDHHAWWSDPDDPDYILLGNDGGIHTTQDRGKVWNFVENLPLAQFYHMRVDNEIPYNVYGGLQDNGSWVGPSQTWFKGGIRNMYWQRLSVGDGFDVVPDLEDSNFGYAMGQAGNLVRYDRRSGQLQRIKPVHPEGEFLRFNWNAGIGIDPIDKNTIYYGSQFLHRSRDKGLSWEIISPDLTTNNPAKQRMLETGGLSYDVTGAENHTTIISVAPSRIKSDVIWVGTDDGHVQVTQDGGQSWNKVSDNMKGVPPGNWVTHIEPSHYDVNTAYVVFDDHRRNNWTPYVFKTENGGNSWTRIIDETDVDRFVYVLAEDPVEPNLLYCGTDKGLYISFDKGNNWNRWTNGMPTMPVSDLVVHPREHDLVIGTFGRSFWILDDVRPLRAIAKNMATPLTGADFITFENPVAILANIGESKGYRQGKVGDVLYGGENRAYGALLSYYLRKPEKANDTVLIEISNENGNCIRHLSHHGQQGLNRLSWNLSRDGVRRLGSQPSNNYPSGKKVLPGIYTVKMAWNGQEQTQLLEVQCDPRISISESDMAHTDALIKDHYSIVSSVVEVTDEIASIKKGLSFVKDRVKQTKGKPEVMQSFTALEEGLEQLTKEYIPKPRQGIYRDPQSLSSVIRQTEYLLAEVIAPLGKNIENQLALEKKACAAFKDKYQSWKSNQFEPFKELIKKHDISIF